MILYSRLDQPEVTALLFPPSSMLHSPCPANAEDVCLDLGAGNTLCCRFYLADPTFPVLLYFPATSGSMQSFDLIAESYRKQGFNIFRVSYRGCGNNSGTPSLPAMCTDSGKVLSPCTQWLSGKGCTGPLFVMGQSLGSICAIDTVLNNEDAVKGLIIESGICSAASFLTALGAVPEQAESAAQDAFDNVEAIEKIKKPTLIFHGARDQLVPVAEAEKLQAASGARTKQFFVIPGAEHHTVSESGGELYIKAIKQFTDTVCGVNTWQQKRKFYKRASQGR